MTPPEIPETSEVMALKEQCAAMRRESNALLGGLIILSFIVTAFLGLQARRAGQELDAIRPQAMQVMEIEKTEDANVQPFLAKVNEYARTHPEFAARIAKYKIQQTNAPIPAK